MMWVDKYCPRHLEDLSCTPAVTRLLERIANKGDIPHLLMYGPMGAGKKTRILALLRKLYGDGIDKIKSETIKPENVSDEFVTIASAYHNQVSAPELGTKDRVCCQYMIKQLSAVSSAFSFGKTDKPKYRVIVIQEAERLSVDAQAGLRRTLEVYVKNARVVLHCQRLSAIIPALRSRCLCIRVPGPTREEIGEVLQHVASQEKLEVRPDYLTQIAHASKRDLRRALIILENAAVSRFPSIESISILPWEAECHRIVEILKKNQSPKTLLDLRENIYDLLLSCLNGDLILQTITLRMIEEFPDALKHGVLVAAAQYSHTMALGQKEVWHLEAFLAQCMSGYKRFIQSVQAG
eukprot:GHVN01040353.1.p1 GENE.GHVN01040353.1~~GHVN01040353.1.p1  ORF type:complete len:351 (+),score=29.68 GHVN01040353.1:83-1135(+)